MRHPSSSRRSSAVCLFQPIEARLLLAASTENPNKADGAEPTAAIHSDGTLIINGTPSRDDITVLQVDTGGRKSPDKGTFKVTIRNKDTGKVKRFTFKSKQTANIKRIEIYGGNRNDNISVQVNENFPTLLDGGKGNDTLRTYTGAATLIGGAGNDKLYSEPFTTGGVSFTGGTGTFFTEFRSGSSVKYRVVADEILESKKIEIVKDNGDGTYVVKFNGGRDGKPITATISAGPKGRPTTIAYPYTGNVKIDKTANRLEGGDGNDQLFSRGGEDSVYGGAGNDKFIALSDGVEVRYTDLGTLKSDKKASKGAPSRVAIFDIESTTTQANGGSVRVTKASV